LYESKGEALTKKGETMAEPDEPSKSTLKEIIEEQHSPAVCETDSVSSTAAKGPPIVQPRKEICRDATRKTYTITVKGCIPFQSSADHQALAKELKAYRDYSDKLYKASIHAMENFPSIDIGYITLAGDKQSWLALENNNIYLYLKVSGHPHGSPKSQVTKGLVTCSEHKYNLLRQAARTPGSYRRARLTEPANKPWYGVYITMELPAPEPFEPKGWIGVGIGWNHLVVAALTDLTGKVHDVTFLARDWKGKKPREEKDWKTQIVQLTHSLQQTFGNPPPSSKLWDPRNKKYRKNAMGVICKELKEIAMQSQYGISLEDDLNFPSSGKDGYLTPTATLQRAIDGMALRNGIPVRYCNPRDTSLECNKCGFINAKNRHGVHFKCLKCGYRVHADANAAINIARRANPSFVRIA
jgi:hypothetical protein